MMFDKARQLADDATGIPSYSHGQTGCRNWSYCGWHLHADGSRQLSVKGVVKNIDDYLLQPLGEAFYAFNMQFDFDPDARGDRGQGTWHRKPDEERGTLPATAPASEYCR